MILLVAFSTGMVLLVRWVTDGEGLRAFRRGRLLRHPSQWRRWLRAGEIGMRCSRSHDCCIEVCLIGQCAFVYCATHQTVRCVMDFFECCKLRAAVNSRRPRITLEEGR